MRPDPAQRDAWRHHRLPPVAEIASGVWSIPVDCGIFPVRFTYCYVVVDDGEVMVVDPGLDSDLGWAQLLEGLEHAGVSAPQVGGIVVTHFHPDHIGMARRLASASGAWVGAHEIEIDHLTGWLTRDAAEANADESAWLEAADADHNLLGGPPAPRMVAMMRQQMMLPDRVLHDGDVLRVGMRSLRIVHTPGHTAGHVCVVDEDAALILTGDHVLPTINPNVGLHAGMLTADPMGSYLDALERLRPFAEFTTLPAHEYAFEGLGERLDGLRSFQEQRADQILAVLAGRRCTVTETARLLVWSRAWGDFPPTDKRLAVATTFAHLRHLEASGRVVACSGVPTRYARVGEA